MNKISMIVLGICFTSALLGCGRKREQNPLNPAGNKIAETAIANALEESGHSDAKVNVDGNQMNIETKDGALKLNTGENVSVPATFPKELTVYPGATVVQTAETPESAHLMLKSQDSQSQIGDYYKKQLGDAGWSTEVAMQTAGGDMLSFRKGPQVIGVMVSRQQDATMISLTLGKR